MITWRLGRASHRIASAFQKTRKKMAQPPEPPSPDRQLTLHAYLEVVIAKKMKARMHRPSLACSAAALFISALLVAPSSSFAQAFTAGTSLRPAAATNMNHRRNLMMFSGGGSGDDDVNEGKAKESKVPIGTYNPLRLAVLKLGLTELRWTSPLNYEKRDGKYKCAYCGELLFTADGKYNSGSGWPSFFRTAEGKVSLYREWDGRIECRCSKCEGHLGHVFPDGPRRMDVVDNDGTGILDGIPASDLQVDLGDPNKDSSRLPRYCMNGAALKFEPAMK